tara:strand:- start:86 stop:259 length:174 start_codon:yes stop_codon:yes gene_type:complete
VEHCRFEGLLEPLPNVEDVTRELPNAILAGLLQEVDEHSPELPPVDLLSEDLTAHHL